VEIIRNKKLINPIIDWSTNEIWSYIRESKIEVCSLYSQGFKRLGCIMCPMKDRLGMLRDAKRYPRYKKLYIRAFHECLKNRINKGLPTTWR